MMLCVLKMRDGNVDGWIIAASLSEAMERAWSAGEKDLYLSLKRLLLSGNPPEPGKRTLASGHLMLVQ